MSQTFSNLEYHIIFSTQDRRSTIPPEMQNRLYDYVGGILKTERCVLLAVGGTADHVHLLISTHTQIAVADLMRMVKSKSSKWIYETFPEHKDFHWQAGYGAFTVSRSIRDQVEKYIGAQEEHHRKFSFRDELAALLKKCGVEFDPRYL